MKRRVFVIGIGAGNPEHLTVQAIGALNQTNVFFVPRKGDEKSDLAQLRRDIIERFVDGKTHRVVEFDYPVRDEANPSYGDRVKNWHGEIESLYARLIAEELGEDDYGAFLAWGDPSLYDSILRILEAIRDKGDIALDYEIVPGITSVQALTAAHGIPLNRIGESVLITTGRKLADGFPEGADSVVVMLDGQAAFKTVDPAFEIYWGAYLGTEDEILIAGTLRDVADEIERVRQQAREKKGWIMDTYLLRRPRQV
jgi:precorrin-6A synthase